MRDTQADVPSAEWRRAQLAFKESMRSTCVHGILQFTPSIAFRYVLHRCESRDIRCRESFWINTRRRRRHAHHVRGGRRRSLVSVPWHIPRRFTDEVSTVALNGLARRAAWGSRPFGDERPRSPSPRVVITRSQVVLLRQVSTMILSQVHLQKPC
jgi:hypothetical protein